MVGAHHNMRNSVKGHSIRKVENLLNRYQCIRESLSRLRIPVDEGFQDDASLEKT